MQKFLLVLNMNLVWPKNHSKFFITGPIHHLSHSFNLHYVLVSVFIISHPISKNKAARLATLGTWRMLTLGAEFSSWAQTSEPNEKQRNRRAAFTELSSKDNLYEESQTARDDQSTAKPSKYDTVIELERPNDLRNTDIISAHEMFQEQVTPWEER